MTSTPIPLLSFISNGTTHLLELESELPPETSDSPTFLILDAVEKYDQIEISDIFHDGYIRIYHEVRASSLMPNHHENVYLKLHWALEKFKKVHGDLCVAEHFFLDAMITELAYLGATAMAYTWWLDSGPCQWDMKTTSAIFLSDGKVTYQTWEHDAQVDWLIQVIYTSGFPRVIDLSLDALHQLLDHAHTVVQGVSPDIMQKVIGVLAETLYGWTACLFFDSPRYDLDPKRILLRDAIKVLEGLDSEQ